MQILKAILEFLASLFTRKEEEKVEEPLVIQDIINDLPWHETRKWSKRAISKIAQIVVHQSLTSYENSTIENINNYHITPGPQNHLSPNGAPHIAYHYGLDKEGNVFQLNNLSYTTWHVKGQNTISLGIMLLGDFTGPTYDGVDQKPTRKQLVNLEKLLNYLVEKEDLNVTKTDVYGHNAFNKPNCPGIVLGAFIEEYNIT